ncbi:MAG: hypothetical protein COB04_08230 [Gammaproteobacteria bacterium]|nr:MAG: hypothetical protein COB04_08230 [Gammaproteobacteria bacterium]
MSNHAEDHSRRCLMQQKMIRALAFEYAHGAIDNANYRQQRKLLIEEFVEMQARVESTSPIQRFFAKAVQMTRFSANVKQSVVLVVSILALFILAYIQSPFMGG